MLQFVSPIKKISNKLGFVDEYSPKEWEPLIDYKLSEYKERAYIDSSAELNHTIVILELDPSDKKLDIEYIKKETKLFKDYYKRILEDIENSEFYDLCLK